MLIKGMIIRGLNPIKPKTFSVTLDSRKLKGTQTTVIAQSDLSKKTDKFEEKVIAQKPVKVDNETYQYVVSAEWQGNEKWQGNENGIQAPVELHSIQIICEI
jgi:hypothetical protein